jgi:hypothetical protein
VTSHDRVAHQSADTHRRIFCIAVSFLTHSLPPFPMWPALPASEYHGGSAPSRPGQSTADSTRSVPGWLPRPPGRAETVPVFTCYRSTREVPSYTPTGPWPYAADLQARQFTITITTISILNGRLHRNLAAAHRSPAQIRQIEALPSTP